MAAPIGKEIKEQILSRVQEGKETVVEIARQHGVKVNTVYGWIQDNAGGITGQTVSMNRLRRENQKLKEIIGSLILQTERGKKDYHG